MVNGDVKQKFVLELLINIKALFAILMIFIRKQKTLNEIIIYLTIHEQAF